MNEEQQRSLESLIEASEQISKNRTLSAFYPHVYWWEMSRYLKLVKKGAIFKADENKLRWDLPQTINDGAST